MFRIQSYFSSSNGSVTPTDPVLSESAQEKERERKLKLESRMAVRKIEQSIRTLEQERSRLLDQKEKLDSKIQEADEADISTIVNLEEEYESIETAIKEISASISESNQTLTELQVSGTKSETNQAQMYADSHLAKVYEIQASQEERRSDMYFDRSSAKSVLNQEKQRASMTRQAVKDAQVTPTDLATSEKSTSKILEKHKARKATQMIGTLQSPPPVVPSQTPVKTDIEKIIMESMKKVGIPN